MDYIETLRMVSGPQTGQMDLANVQGHFNLMSHQITRMR